MLTIKQATTADISLINKLAWEVFPITYGDILTKEQSNYMMEWMYSPTNLHKQIEEEGHIYFILYKEEEAAGYLSIQPETETLYHLQKIYVLPRFQGYGIGKILFEHAINYIQKNNSHPCAIRLNVNRNNKAQYFYEKMGMQRIAEGDFDIGNGFYMNDYIMELKLNQ